MGVCLLLLLPALYACGHYSHIPLAVSRPCSNTSKKVRTNTTFVIQSSQRLVWTHSFSFCRLNDKEGGGGCMGAPWAVSARVRDVS